MRDCTQAVLGLDSENNDVIPLSIHSGVPGPNVLRCAKCETPKTQAAINHDLTSEQARCVLNRQFSLRARESGES